MGNHIEHLEILKRAILQFSLPYLWKQLINNPINLILTSLLKGLREGIWLRAGKLDFTMCCIPLTLEGFILH